MYIQIILLFSILAVKNSICDERPAVPFVPAVADHIVKTVKQCMEEYDNDPKVIDLIKEGSYGTDESFKKFVYCSYYKSGYANQDGSILPDKVIKAFPENANIGDVTKKCSEIRANSPEETAYEFFKCFELNAPIRIGLN